MTSTGAAAAADVSLRDRRRDSPGPAPVFQLPQERPPPATLLDLLRKVDARGPATLPGEQRSEHAFKVATCGERFYRARCGCGRRLLPSTCKDRLCPRCERSRAAKACARYEVCFAGRPWVRHLVFTTRKFALGELAPSIDFTHRSLRKLRHSKLCRDFLEGGTTSIETKGYPPGSSRAGWHTHAHVLSWGRGWVPIAALSLKWCQVTGGRVNWKKFHALPGSVQRASAGSGHLKAILSTPEESPYGCVEKHGRGIVVHAKAVERDLDGRGFRDALQEALKYVTKGAAATREEEPTAGWTPEMGAEFYAATRNRNLFQKFGDCPKVGELPERPCEHCGQKIQRCGGHHVQALSRDDAERWAAELDPRELLEGVWTLADQRDYEERLRRFEGRPAP